MADSIERETTQLPRDEWGAFLSTFSTENRGSVIRAELVGKDVGDQTLMTGPLMAIDYDPEGKGDDIVITIGDENYEHVVRGPVELWTARDSLGRIGGLEIVATDDVRTIISL